MIYKIHNRKTSLKKLLTLWEESVISTHNFLTDNDISYLKPYVENELLNIKNLIVYSNDNEINAFMGIDNDKIEMLFVDPKFAGKGIGKQLITYAIKTFNIKYVDVNEQNTQALAFYQHMGFTVYQRDETDGLGNPFPILHMKKDTK